MQRILGIDPGLAVTGYAVVESDGHSGRLIASGTLATRAHELPARLGIIFSRLCDVIREHHPQAAAVEAVFVHKDASAALKLGQARGVALCAAVTHQVPVYEYDTRVVKRAVVGKGNADKQQVQFMVSRLLQVAERRSHDETDAMAIALCHAFSHAADTRINRLLRERAG